MTVNTIMSMQIRQCSASTTSCDKLFFRPLCVLTFGTTLRHMFLK